MPQPRPPAGHLTFHLTPAAVWQAQHRNAQYIPEAFEREGFVHCTDDLTELVAVGNRYYLADDRIYVCLVISCDELDQPVVYEDEAQLFPHIYGPIPKKAISAVRDVLRAADGRFTAVAE